MYPKCKHCSTDITTQEHMICYGDCQGKFHFECSVPEDSYRRMTLAKKKSWRCNICNKPKLTRSTSITQQEDESDEKPMQSEIKDIKDMLKTILLKMNDIEAIKSDIEDLKQNRSLISDQYTAIQSQLEENNQLINNMENSIEILKGENQEKDKQIRDINFKLNKLEQLSRSRNIEIAGLPQIPQEDCIDVVLDLAKEVKINLKHEDIETAYRMSTKNKNISPSIIVQFLSKDKREEFLSKKNIIKYKDTRDEKKVYINEHISPYYKQLLMMTKHAAREANYKFVWFRKDKILVRKSEDSVVLKIESEHDIFKIRTSN